MDRQLMVAANVSPRDQRVADLAVPAHNPKVAGSNPAPARLPRNHPGIRRCADDNGMADTPVEESKVNREELRVIEETTVDVACHLSLIRVWDPTREEAG